MTANPGRIGTHKMSAAFCNRVVQMWLPELDYGLTASNAEQHDLMRLLAGKLAGIHGGNELALLALQMHATMKQLVQDGTVHLMPGFRITARDVLRCAECCANNIAQCDKPVSPVLVMARELLRAYAQLKLESRQEQALVVQRLAHMLSAKQLSKQAYKTPEMPYAGKATALKHAARELTAAMASLQHDLLQVLWCLTASLTAGVEMVRVAKQVRITIGSQPLHACQARQHDGCLALYDLHVITLHLL
jgi:hypothetical protein